MDMEIPEISRLWLIDDDVVLDLPLERTEKLVEQYYLDYGYSNFRYKLGLQTIDGMIFLMVVTNQDKIFAGYGKIYKPPLDITDVEISAMASMFKKTSGEIYAVYKNILDPDQVIH